MKKKKDIAVSRRGGYCCELLFNVPKLLWVFFPISPSATAFLPFDLHSLSLYVR
jgi:uncharacterized membrane protein YpjA